MSEETNFGISTEDQIARLADKIERMHQRTISVASPLKARYAELRDEMRMLDRAV